MKLDKITRKLSEAFTNSIQVAEEHKNSEQTEEHLIFSILNDDSGMAEIILNHLKLDRNKFKNLASQSIARLPRIQGINHIDPSRGLMNLLQKSDGIRSELKDEYLSTEHVLVAFLRDSSTNLKNDFIK